MGQNKTARGGDTSVLSLKVRQGAVKADRPGLPFMTCAASLIIILFLCLHDARI